MGNYEVWLTIVAFISNSSHKIQLSIWVLKTMLLLKMDLEAFQKSTKKNKIQTIMPSPLDDSPKSEDMVLPGIPITNIPVL